MQFIDLNCDMGESYGIYRLGQDRAILPFVSSVNIACGFHGGDPGVMRQTVAQALGHRVAIGAHPGLPDLQGFGRRKMVITPEEVYDLTIYQVGALQGFVTAQSGRLHHVKPHGALYHMAANDAALALAMAQAIRDLDPNLMLYGPAGSVLVAEAAKLGLRAAQEVFADRRYRSDGTLVARSEPEAVLHNAQEALAQALQLAESGQVEALDGVRVSLQADTICLHGDHANAAAMARFISNGLQDAGIALCAP
jgi:UPF0271 protein